MSQDKLIPPCNDNRTAAELVADGDSRWPDGTIYLPPNLTGIPRKRFLRTLLRLEAVLDPASELATLRRDFTRAGGAVVCDQCGTSYFDHPADVDDEPDLTSGAGLVILCNRARVKL